VTPRLWPRQIGHALIVFYRVTLSAALGRQCRYLPTCSAYTDEAVLKHGLWAGSWMGAARICRCHPWGGSGYDPVPEIAGGSALTPWRHGVWKMRCE